MTAAYIAFHAAQRPDGVALIDNGHAITYAEFSRDIRKFTRALREFDLSYGAPVAVVCENVYIHWLLRLACEELGLVTASLLPEQANLLGLDPSLGEFDLVLSDKMVDGKGIARHHLINPQWLEAVQGREDNGELPAISKRPEDPLRILHTSGTTGTPKRLLYPRRVHERSVAKSMWFNGVTHRSRYQLAIPFTVGASYANATACIRSGATIVFNDRMPVPEVILRHGITHLAVPPFYLKQTLDDLPHGFARPAELTIFSFGAALSSALREKALAGLANEICDMYGSNEAGYVSSIRSRSPLQTGFGGVWPGVQVQIVDDRDRPLPYGEQGHIRVKTDCMVQGYLDDPKASHRMFRDGWFYAGDIGVLADPFRLEVLGRGDELLNIGWRKLSPAFLEGLVMKIGDVGDVGVCSLPNAEGIEEIYVAVSRGRTSYEDLIARLNKPFTTLQLGRYYVVPAARIPRNANGKIQRDVLKQDIVMAIGRKAPPAF